MSNRQNATQQNREKPSNAPNASNLVLKVTNSNCRPPNVNRRRKPFLTAGHMNRPAKKNKNVPHFTGNGFASAPPADEAAPARCIVPTSPPTERTGVTPSVWKSCHRGSEYWPPSTGGGRRLRTLSSSWRNALSSDCESSEKLGAADDAVDEDGDDDDGLAPSAAAVASAAAARPCGG